MVKKKSVSKEKGKGLYRKLLTIRLFEEKLDELFRQGKVPGTIHVSIGQEAVAVGFAEAMTKEDLVIATHRGHGHCIMRGADLRRMMAELMGKATGLNKGKGGSMHILDVANGMLGATGIVGMGLPIAVGVGRALKMNHSDKVCVCFFGDDAAAGGSFHEALNVASLWKLPVVFACENNLYGISVSISKTCCIEDIAKRAAGYCIPGAVVDGMDVLEVKKVANKAIERARKGEGPSLIECKTYRFLGHSRGDPNYGPYRTKEEWDSWKKRDPLAAIIRDAGIEKAEIIQIEKEISEIINDAVRYGEESPPPDVRTALEDIYA